MVAQEPSDPWANLEKLVNWRQEGYLTEEQFEFFKKGLVQSR